MHLHQSFQSILSTSKQMKSLKTFCLLPACPLPLTLARSTNPHVRQTNLHTYNHSPQYPSLQPPLEKKNHPTVNTKALHTDLSTQHLDYNSFYPSYFKLCNPLLWYRATCPSTNQPILFLFLFLLFLNQVICSIAQGKNKTIH